MNATPTKGLGRLFQLAPALVGSCAAARKAGLAGSALEVLRAARLDTHVIEETRRIMSDLPDGVVEKFAAYYKDRDPSNRKVKSKYYNLPVHVAHAVWQAKQLGLYRVDKKLTIVDLGTGFGYFPLACDSIGHKAAGLDWDRWKVYDSISGDIPIDRSEWIVTPDEPMPDMGVSVDLVTAFRPVFYYEFDCDSLWGEEKWRRFFSALVRHLSPDGRVYIGENRISQGQKPALEAMRALFREVGAEPHQNGWLFATEALARLSGTSQAHGMLDGNVMVDESSRRS